MSDACVLDSSAVLCLLFRETGHSEVEQLISQSCISAVNFSEVLTKLQDRKFSPDDIAAFKAEFKPSVVAFDHELAIATGELRSATRSKGLSLGDRACLALAASMGATAVTTDQAWKDLGGIARVMLVR